MGRPTKLTPELSAKVVALLEAGWFPAHAAAEVGIHYDTLRAWQRAGEKTDADEMHEEFSVRCARARVRGVRAKLEKAQGKADTGEETKFDVWLLERLDPENMRPTQRTEITGADGGAVQIAKVVLMPPEETIGEADAADPMAAKQGAAD